MISPLSGTIRRHSWASRVCRSILAAAFVIAGAAFPGAVPPKPGATVVSIAGDAFHVNGQPTLKGRTWRGHRVEGLLPNSRMVQGVFDDLNPETRGRWVYPDTKTWDPARNTREFVAATSAYASWGFFDFRRAGEGLDEGYQSVPVNWGISTARKKAFFEIVVSMSR